MLDWVVFFRESCFLVPKRDIAGYAGEIICGPGEEQSGDTMATCIKQGMNDPLVREESTLKLPNIIRKSHP